MIWRPLSRVCAAPGWPAARRWNIARPNGAAPERDGGESALAALTGHATSVLFRTAPNDPLESRPLLPGLGLPTMAQGLRPRFRRILAAQKGGPSIERHVIDLVTARGRAAHPADWMPSPRDDRAPDIYAPWLDWVRAETQAAAQSELTVETYGRWSWAERRVALAQLRAADPRAALAIIAAKAGGEPAERRVRLLEILEVELSDADAEFLESLANDRSDRVQAMARGYLARLGRGADASNLAAELAEMVEFTKVGLIDRRRRLMIKQLNNSAQRARRADLFKLVSLAGLARALGVSEMQLVEAAPDGVPEGIDAFAQMVATTGSDAARRMLIDRMLADATFPALHIRPLAPRLSAEERRALAAQIITRESDGLDTTLTVAGRELGGIPLSALLASPFHATLSGLLDRALDGADGQRTQANTVLAAALNRVALLLDAAGAAAMLERVASSGLSPADPKLDLMALNAALKPETTP